MRPENFVILSHYFADIYESENHLLWEQEAAGSSPVSPIDVTSCKN